MVILLLSLIVSVCIQANQAAEVSCDAPGSCDETKTKLRDLSETQSEKNRDIGPSKYRQRSQPQETQFWVSFINDRNQEIELFYDDRKSRKGRPNGKIGPLSEKKYGTYHGHRFFIRYPGKDEILKTFVMDRNRDKYILHASEKERTLESEAKQKERAFKEEYRNRTGRQWNAYYPREPTKLYIYPITEIGQKFHVKSKYGHYHCYPESLKEEDINKCRDNKSFEFDIVTHSVSPKVMSITGFLSDFECDHIIDLAVPKLKRSTIGQGENIEVSYHRTSTSTFLSRTESEIIDWIYLRIGEAMKINDQHLRNNFGCEDLQILHYDVGQQFFDHPDYNTKTPNMRYLTFLMYLNDVEEGGETAFPHIGLNVIPKKGNVALFYSMREDGNVDIGSIHAGRPIIKGEKWAAPLWIWDPYKS